MTTAINMEQLKKDAVDIFCNGFACSESVIYALRKHFQIELSDDAIAMSSGFPWKNARCFALTEEFHDAFKKTFGATCCRILTKGMERDSKERKDHCIKMVDFTVEKVSEIILRELNADSNK